MTKSDAFVGAWRLICWEIVLSDGTVVFPYGKDVVGYLIYTADGHMSAQIMDPDRRQSDSTFPLQSAAAQTLSDPDRARAYTTYLSYCGTYRVEDDSVIHHVKAALIPSWTGSEQVRRFKFDKGCLILKSGAHTLRWERAAEHVCAA